MKQEYTVDYFIKKFEAIPGRLWCVSNIGSGEKHCALGHCGVKLASSWSKVEEANALQNVVKQIGSFVGVAEINDGLIAQYSQPTPKQRILAALCDVKKMQIGYTILEKPPIQYENAIPEILKSIQNPTVETDVIIQPRFQ